MYGSINRESGQNPEQQPLLYLTYLERMPLGGLPEKVFQGNIGKCS